MTTVNKKEPTLLALGDLLILVFSLFVTLVLRYQSMPPVYFINSHALPFGIIFFYSLVVFYISGLYGRMIHISRSNLPWIVIRAQVANGILAVFIFYFFQNFSVTPKLNLFIYFLLSTVFLISWRLNTYSLLSLRKKQPALVVGSGIEVEEIVNEMNRSPRSFIFCKKHITLENLSLELGSLDHDSDNYKYIVIDPNNPNVSGFLPELYKKLFPETSLVNIYDFYEDLFDRIPLSCINYTWIMSHIKRESTSFYDALKRLADIILSIFVSVFTLVCYPFVFLAIKIEDGGPVLITQKRVGKDNKTIFIKKFRSMTHGNDHDKWVRENDSENKVTNVGKILRTSRIDELPQVMSVLKGDMSFIGPRSDIYGLGLRLESEIPYYAIRSLIPPGLSGWAQVNQEKPPQSVEETKIRLSYDLFYIKHRSINLDLKIALKTIKTLLSRVGM